MLLVSMITCLTLMACSPHEWSDHEPSESQSIIGGSPIYERSSQAARSVVLIELLNSRGQALAFCSATLIAKDTLLSAAHCFSSKNIPGLHTFRVHFTNTYRKIWGTSERQGLSFLIHPKFNSTGQLDHDIAVATFSGGLPSGYAPVNIDTDIKADYSRNTVYVYGYGRSRDYTGRRNEDIYAYMGQLHRGVLQIDSSYSKFADRYWTTPSVPAFICQGDSGGPQFYHENGVLKVIGVNSAVIFSNRLPNGQVSCKSIGQATKVAYFAEWIKSTRAKITTVSWETSEGRSFEFAHTTAQD